MGASPAKSRLRKWLLRLAILVAVLGVSGCLLRNFLVRVGLEEAVTEATGFPLDIGGLRLGMFRATVDVRDLRLSNPEGFGDPRCLHAPRLAASVEALSVFREVLHVEDLVIDVAEVVVVKNAAGETNLDRLAALGGGKEDGDAAGPGKEPGGKPEAKAKERRWKCDRLRLRIGRVVFLDYTKARDGKPKESSWDLGVDEEFRDIDGPKKVARLIVLKVLTKTPIRLAGATVESLVGGLGGVADSAGRLLEGVGEGVGRVVEGVGRTLDDLLGGEKKEEPPPPPPPKKRR